MKLLTVVMMAAICGCSAPKQLDIQAEIDAAAAKGGGTVVVPAGVHNIQPFELKSNVTLQLAKGARLVAPTDIKLYPVRDGSPVLIGAYGAENVAIVGEGVIDGQGSNFKEIPGTAGEAQPQCVPVMMRFSGCKNVKLEDFKCENAGAWGIHLRCSDGVVVRRVKSFSHCADMNDGLDIESRNVLVEDCYFDNDDDALVFKAESDPDFAITNVVVRNCKLASCANAIKFGTGSYGLWKDILIENCEVVRAGKSWRFDWGGSPDDPNKPNTERHDQVPGTAPGIVVGLAGIALEVVDGGIMENVTIRNITITGVQVPIFARLDRRHEPKAGKATYFKNVLIENVKGEGESSVTCSISGTPGRPISGITWRNVDLVMKGGGTELNAREEIPEMVGEYPECIMFDKKALPAWGCYLRHADGVRFENVKFTLKAGAKDARPKVVTDEVMNFYNDDNEAAYKADYWTGYWIWLGNNHECDAVRYFRKSFEIEEPANYKVAALQGATDDYAEAYLNGQHVGSLSGWAKAQQHGDVRKFLKPGKNELVIEAKNGGGAAAFMAELTMIKQNGEIFRLGTDKTWEAARVKEGPWQAAEELMKPPMLPYGETVYKDYRTGRMVPVYPEPDISKVVMKPGKLVAEMRKDRGGMHYFKNGWEQPFILYRAPINMRHTVTCNRFLKGFGEQGIPLAEIAVSFQQLWNKDGSLNEAELEKYILGPLVYAPNVDVIVFLNTDAPAWYVQAHADERYVTNEGKALNRMSYASKEYKADSAAFLKKIVKFLKSKPYYNRIAGFGLDGGEDGQYMEWTGRPIKYIGDYSKPMNELYGGKQPEAARRLGNKDKLVLDPKTDADVIKCNRYYGAAPAAYVLACAKALKEVTQREKLVAAYYGKFYSIAGYLEYGELALRKVLDSKDIDALIAVEYNHRGIGEPHSVSAPLASYAMHGKAFIDEADNRTMLDGSNSGEGAKDLFGSISQLRKLFLLSYTRGHGMHWYDLHGGMFEHPALHKEIGKIIKVANRVKAESVKPAEIAVVCDEETYVKTTAAIKDESRRLVLHQCNGQLGKLGAPFDLLMANDLKDAPKYKYYVFLFCFAPTKADAAEIAAIKASGAGWVEVKPGDAALKAEDLREAARKAGVHIYSDRNDTMVYVGRGLLGVHAGLDGERTIAWPKGELFADAITGEEYKADDGKLKLTMQRGETRIFYVGKFAEKEAEDVTEKLQAMIDDKSRHEIVLTKGDWVTRPLFIKRSDLTIKLEDGARLVAKRGEYHWRNDEIISIADGVKNINILGEGNAEFYMHLKDYQDASNYTFSEWRHCIRVWKAENVTIKGLTFRGAGGDGVAINGSRNVRLENCKFYDCNRLGLGVVTVHDMIVRKCYFEANDGTPPCCGADFEPNYSNEPIVNVLVEDCDFVNHKCAGGLLFHLSPLKPTSEPVSVVVRNCRSVGNKSFGYRVTAAGGNGPVKGTFVFENCISENNSGCDVELDGLSDEGIKFEFKNCNFTKFRKSNYEKLAGVAQFLPRQVKPLDATKKVRKSGFLRRDGTFVQHVAKAGKYKVHFDMMPSDPPRVPSAEVTLSDHAGTPLGTTRLTGKGGDVEFESRGENCYTFSVKMSDSLVSMVSDIPGMGLRMDRHQHMYTGRKHQYLFTVPAKQEEVTVALIGEEPVAANIINAAGEVVASGESPRGVKNITAKRKPTAKDEVWTLDFTKVVEDCYFSIPEPLFPYVEVK